MKVSVIIPHLNSLNSLQSTVLSHLFELKRAKVEAEIIIVDNGTLDISLELLKKWVNSMAPSSVTLLKEKNMGTIPPLQLGAENATGDILCFSDMHIFLAPNYYKILLKNFEDEKVAVVYPKVSFIGPDTELIYHYNFDPISLHTKFAYHDKPPTKPYLVGTSELCGVLVRATAFSEMGMFNKKAFIKVGGYTAEETMLGLKTWMFGYKAVFDPRALCIHGSIDRPAESLGLRNKPDSLVVLSYLMGGEAMAKEAFEYWKLTQFKTYYPSFAALKKDIGPNLDKERDFIKTHAIYTWPQTLLLFGEWGVAT
jgi:glycosyltransferase involved in cell wall biosynthesis